MPGWCLVAVVLVIAADPDPSVLVSKLGSKNLGERESAAVALEALGTRALSAHAHRPQRARRRYPTAGRSADQEDRGRSTPPLLARLARLQRPPDVGGHPEHRHRDGLPSPDLRVQKDWLATRITLQNPSPVPFWKTVDRLCEAGRFQYNLGTDPGGLASPSSATKSLARHRPWAIPGPDRRDRFNHRYRQVHLGRSGLHHREEGRG